MHPTIRDVAQKLNLSITTVSRALDGYGDVAEPTRRLAIKTARILGYAPNRAARQLRRGLPSRMLRERRLLDGQPAENPR